MLFDISVLEMFRILEMFLIIRNLGMFLMFTNVRDINVCWRCMLEIYVVRDVCWRCICLRYMLIKGRA